MTDSSDRELGLGEILGYMQICGMNKRDVAKAAQYIKDYTDARVLDELDRLQFTVTNAARNMEEPTDKALGMYIKVRKLELKSQKETL